MDVSLHSSVKSHESEVRGELEGECRKVLRPSRRKCTLLQEQRIKLQAEFDVLEGKEVEGFPLCKELWSLKGIQDLEESVRDLKEIVENVTKEEDDLQKETERLKETLVLEQSISDVLTKKIKEKNNVSVPTILFKQELQNKLRKVTVEADNKKKTLADILRRYFPEEAGCCSMYALLKALHCNVTHVGEERYVDPTALNANPRHVNLMVQYGLVLKHATHNSKICLMEM